LSDYLPERVLELEEHRMVGRQRLQPVIEHETQVQVVARPPDSALAVNEALDARLGLLAAHVEVADGKRLRL
jgi:hypothetical protein